MKEALCTSPTPATFTLTTHLAMSSLASDDFGSHVFNCATEGEGPLFLRSQEDPFGDLNSTPTPRAPKGSERNLLSFRRCWENSGNLGTRPLCSPQGPGTEGAGQRPGREHHGQSLPSAHLLGQELLAQPKVCEDNVTFRVK